MPEIHTIAEVVGLIGAFTYIFAYVQLQLKRDYAKTVTYSFMNFSAGCMVLFSLYFMWNTAAVIGNTMWVVMSLYGMYRTYRQDNPEKVETLEGMADVIVPDMLADAVGTVAEAVQDVTPVPAGTPPRKKRKSRKARRKKKKNRHTRVNKTHVKK